MYSSKEGGDSMELRWKRNLFILWIGAFLLRDGVHAFDIVHSDIFTRGSGDVRADFAWSSCLNEG